MTLKLRPVTQRDARAYVGAHHRHNLPPRGAIAQVGLTDNGELVGVAILGRPVARALDDGYTAEVTRLTTDGTRNACSKLYGAMRRAAQALGYRRLYTYTLESESGASLLAAGFVLDATLTPRPTWDGGERHRVQHDLFGEERRPAGAKIRWRLDLVREP